MLQQLHPERMILLVTDRPELSAVLRQLINETVQVSHILAASNVTAALEQLDQHRVAVMIIDYGLADTDGLHLATTVKQQIPDTYTILLISSDERHIERLALAHGVDYCLQKPFSLHLFERVMRAAIADLHLPKKPG